MLGRVGNVNLPTPVVLAGAGLCMLGGYLIGVVAGPEAPDRTTGVVDSYHSSTRKLCLKGDSVAKQDGAKDGVLCGVWQRAAGSENPNEGDRFRFVAKVSHGQSGRDDDKVLIFGEIDN
jgi:hypothetical protein